MPTRSRPFAVTAGIGACVLLLTIPLPAPVAPDAAQDASSSARSRPFVWGRDSLWQTLQRDFVAARTVPCADSLATTAALDSLGARIADARPRTLAPSAAILDTIESQLFAVAPRVAACPAHTAAFVDRYARMRELLKGQSAAWDVNSTEARDRLYRALNGGRSAVEEVTLQHTSAAGTLLLGTDEPSATPSAISNGVRLHSGDILVSRGGYPTSALIARGNDYPGHFSHISLVHVDSTTRAITVIEAHIELGVALATADRYLADKKLRVMLLRPRADLPALRNDPLLPHRAAERMLQRAQREHIPYDFTMDYRDATRLFCSEVASAGYRAEGLELWMGRSTISRPGLRDWLASFGVQHFETQEPSDLEYDPQLHVVAEWRDQTALFEDHIDNAVTDVMLEGAERGDRLGFAWYELPLARVLKGWSVLRTSVGGVGPIPEGMSPSAALRNRGYGARHDALTAEVRALADAWRTRAGYPPPYWVLVDLAREAVAN